MRTVLLIVGILLLGAQTYAQNGQTVIVTAKESQEPRLSADLSWVTRVDGEFLGLTPDNEAAVRVKGEDMAQALNLVSSVNVDPAARYEEVSLLVSYAGGRRLAAKTLGAAGLEQVGESVDGRFVVAKPKGGVTAAELRTLLDDNAVTHVEPNYILSVPPEEFVADVVSADFATDKTPNDPLFAQLWGMTNIHAPQAWDCLTDVPNIVVAVIDSGVDYRHPDLAANMWKSAGGKFGHDFFDDDDDPMDEHNHGTHCGGTIAGVGNNGVGVAGVAWQTKIMAMRFLGPNGSGSVNDAIDCIDWAVKNGAHILSNSWGGGGFSQKLQEAIARAEKQGVLFVAAAGNSNTDNDASPHFPSTYPNLNIIAVGSIDSADARSGFSCFGKKTVDIGAPGSAIVSTIRDKKYASFNGTSMATPHVSGAAVLVWGKTFAAPQQDVNQMKTVRDLILKNARAVPGLVDRWGHAAPAVVKGGVLDVAFLCGSQTPAEPPKLCCAVVAAAQFDSGTVLVKENQTIVDVKIHLDVAAEVHVVANTSATATAPVRFTNGFSDQSVNHMWVPSLRWVQVKNAGEWENFGSTASVKLPAGDHRLRWNVWVAAGTELKFDAGSMLVQAYPLAAADATALASVESVEAVKLKSGVDAAGNAGVTRSETATARSQPR